MVLSGAIVAVSQAIQSVVSWFMGLIPRPLRVFFFLFFVVFLINILLNSFLGVFYTCIDDGLAFKVSKIQMNSYDDLINNNLEDCPQVRIEQIENKEQEILARLGQNFSFIDLMKGGAVMYLGNLESDYLGTVDTFIAKFTGRYDRCEKLIDLTTQDTNSVSRTMEKLFERASFEQGIAIQCVPDENGDGDLIYVPRFFYYGMNIFEKRLWVIGSILMLVLPFAIKWKEIFD